MQTSETIVLQRGEVESLLGIKECMKVVEEAFRLKSLGLAGAPGILGVHAAQGGFHIKAGILKLNRPYFAAKINANFPKNRSLYSLPTIQGVIAVFDPENGKLLALMDSIALTIIRTGAATGVAAKYLAREDASVVTVCGCGNQGRISLKALQVVRTLEHVYAYDVDSTISASFAKNIRSELGITAAVVEDLPAAVRQSDIVITCTPSKKFFLNRKDISPGTFIAAVGADSEDKQELEPSLLAIGKLVVDSVEQCATIGELHHALDAGVLTRNDVYAELGDVIASLKAGRQSKDEITIFDSTGTALQDAAAAAIVYEKAMEKKLGISLDFAR